MFLCCVIQNDHMDKIIIEPSIMEDPMIVDDEDFVDIRARFKTWNEGKSFNQINYISL